VPFQNPGRAGALFADHCEGATHIHTDGRCREVARNRSTLKHLSYSIDPASDSVLVLHPGALFLDIRDAMGNAKLLSCGLNIRHFRRGGVGQKTYQFDLSQLELALTKGRSPKGLEFEHEITVAKQLPAQNPLQPRLRVLLIRAVELPLQSARHNSKRGSSPPWRWRVGNQSPSACLGVCWLILMCH
jgi:hypothetical protein